MQTRLKKIQSYKDLVAWQLAFKLGLLIYRICEDLPRHEQFGLASQLRRGAVSVASNIAEGYGRSGRIDYLRFLKIARGSLYEVETQLLFAEKLKYGDSNRITIAKSALGDCERVLAGLIRSLETQNDTQT
jgi:four helix bundle protein